MEKNEKKLISVIIPAFNAEKTIKRCIESVINQTYPNIEIIIINDGSKDNTKKICEEFEKKCENIILINNTNRGVSYSRNYGINIATGDYITFLDSDDYLELECYEKISKHFDDNIECIRYNLNNIDGKSFNNDLYDLRNKTFETNEFNKKKIMNHFLTNKESIPNLIMLLVIKKDKLSKIKFSEDLIMMEDADFFINLLSILNNIRFIDEKLYNYVKNPASVTHNPEKCIDIIYGILNTNIKLNDRLNKIEYKELVKNMNANHLKIISNYLEFYFLYNSRNFIKKVKEIRINERIEYLLNNSNFDYLPAKNKIHIIIFKNKNIRLLYFYTLIYTKIKYYYTLIKSRIRK